MNSNQRSRLKKVTAGATIVALAGFLYYLWVRFTALRIPCLFHEITGLNCPGCGTTRMCVALINLNFAAAFEFNPVLCVSLPVLAVIGLTMAWRYVKLGTGKLVLWQNICLWLIIIALLIQCIWRNVVVLMG